MLWGGREGYETLLNTDMKRELDQLGALPAPGRRAQAQDRLQGPAPASSPSRSEPTKHQYDFDTATVYAFLQRYGLSTDDFKVNIEANHATLAGHSFEHEVAYAARQRHLRQHRHEPRRSAARLGHRPVPQRHRRDSRWSSRASSQAAVSPPAASTSTPRCAARASTPRTCSTATSGGMDNLARALLIADKMLTDGKLQGIIDERYAGLERGPRPGHPGRQGDPRAALRARPRAKARSEAPLRPPGDAREPGQPVRLRSGEQSTHELFVVERRDGAKQAAFGGGEPACKVRPVEPRSARLDDRSEIGQILKDATAIASKLDELVDQQILGCDDPDGTGGCRHLHRPSGALPIVGIVTTDENVHVPIQESQP